MKYGDRVCGIRPDQVSELDPSRVAPIRISKAYPGRENYFGVYRSATRGRHHWFESLYEKTALSVLDRDRDVVDRMRVLVAPDRLGFSTQGLSSDGGRPNWLSIRSLGDRN
ncbi:hypothetical protein [Microbacterium sp.]|uniref:hypothetical protein n=1 Tax=Microbacterium sp. TaxID=51671 RepID=UPI003A914BE0